MSSHANRPLTPVRTKIITFAKRMDIVSFLSSFFRELMHTYEFPIKCIIMCEKTPLCDHEGFMRTLQRRRMLYLHVCRRTNGEESGILKLTGF